MTVPRLTFTPLFSRNFWAEPLIDSSWINLPSNVLEDDHVLSWILRGYPAPAHIGDYDGIDFTLALGIPLPPALISHADPYDSGYNTGRARAWAYLLHYQVLDFLLQSSHPRTNLDPIEQTNISFSRPTHMLLKKLQDWPRYLDAFKALLPKSPSAGDPPEDPARTSIIEDMDLEESAESLRPILHFSELQENTLASKAFKNFQAMASGLMSVLEVRKLVRFYANDKWDETHESHHYVNADIRLDPNLEDVTFDRKDEVIEDLARAEERLAALCTRSKVGLAKLFVAMFALAPSLSSNLFWVGPLRVPHGFGSLGEIGYGQ
ncbi:hypothetical protein B0H14DRAFT_2603644 [Mycena olivaceomarginata]|nr:hypothetical protein B0H14DRAFT_2603644 [Mycena olivaceomarginata]